MIQVIPHPASRETVHLFTVYARAGDAGRGFAVVASEAKELASQTNLANADIKQKINIIPTAIGSTLSSIKNVSTIDHH